MHISPVRVGHGSSVPLAFTIAAGGTLAVALLTRDVWTAVGAFALVGAVTSVARPDRRGWLAMTAGFLAGLAVAFVLEVLGAPTFYNTGGDYAMLLGFAPLIALIFGGFLVAATVGFAVAVGVRRWRRVGAAG